MAEVDNLIQKGFERSWNVFKNDLVLFVLAGLVVVVVGILTLCILLPPLMIGFIRIIEKRLAGEDAAVGDVFGLGLSSFLPALIAGILISIGVSIGSMLLVIPGIIVGIFTAFAFHTIAYDDAGAISSIKASIDLVKGNFLMVFIVMVIVGALATLGSALAGIGSLLTFPFSIIFMTVVFEQLRSAGGAQAA